MCRDRIQEVTQGSYSQGWMAWMRFCQQYNRDPLVVTEDRICCFCAWMGLTRAIQGKTMRGYCYGVRSECIERGVHVNLREDAMPQLHGVWEGRGRDDIASGRKKDPKYAITNDILDAWFEDYRADETVSEWDKKVWTTFALISQQTLRRSAEMLQKEMGGMDFGVFDFESGHDTGYPIWGKHESWARMTFSGSKTTRCAKRKGEVQVAVISCHCRYGDCALHSLIDLFRAAPSIGKEEKVFRLSDGRVIDYAMELAWVKARALATEMDPTRFSTHGFRAGGCIDHFDEHGEGEKEVTYVKNQALWRGDMHQYYNSKRDAEQQGIRALRLAGFCTADQRRRRRFKKKASRRKASRHLNHKPRRMGFFGRRRRR